MKKRVWLPVILCAMTAIGAAGLDERATAQAGGTIEGHVKLTGTPPENVPIRMNWDVNCLKINTGKRVLHDTVLTSANGDLANVFAYLDGSFPEATGSTQAAPEIDQEGCVYHPRVQGARVGQTLQVKNSDQTIHNIHGITSKGNAFNATLSQAGMAAKFQLKGDEVILRVKCDVHVWMTGYVGVVNHPYFAVSGTNGEFKISGVPAGKQTIRVWHELYGPLTQTVDVKAGATTPAHFVYTGNEKPSGAPGFAVQQLVIPAGTTTIQLLAAVR
jgi:plastocyanin